MLQLDDAVNQVLGRTPMPKGMRRMLGSGNSHRPRGKSAAPLLDRQDVFADVREISVRLGVQSPRLLTWEIYRINGGQYSFDEFKQFGGFDTVRRAA